MLSRTRPMHLALLTLYLLLFSLLPSLAQTAPTPPASIPTMHSNALFTDPASSAEDMSAATSLDNGVIRARRAQLNADALAQAAASQALGRVMMDSGLILNLFEDAVYTAYNTSIAARPSAQPGYVWIGSVPALPYSDVVLVVADTAFSGQIVSAERNFRFSMQTDNTVLIEEIDGAAMHQRLEHDYIIPPAPPAGTQTLLPDLSSASADDGSVIDVMILYTPAARNRKGGSTAMLSAIDTMVAASNTMYTNSGVQFQLRLVHIAEINYLEGIDMIQDLNRLTAIGDGYLDSVHPLRDQHNADLVALLTYKASSSYCGLAWVLQAMDNIAFRQQYGFSITDANCMTGSLTFPHELGHNAGGAHDRANSPANAGITNEAYGYQDPTRAFVTVMAYPVGGACPNLWTNGVCTPIPRFSAPDQTYNGRPLGTVNPPTNMVKVLNQTRTFVANFRQGAPLSLSPFALISPADNDTIQNPSVNFVWEVQPEADFYRLQINSNGVSLFNKVVNKDACNTTTCTFNPASDPDWRPPVHQPLKWTVTARTNSGRFYRVQPRRTLLTDFLPTSITQDSPEAAATVTNPHVILRWVDDQRIQQYQLRIFEPGGTIRNLGWQSREQAACNGATCAVEVNLAGFDTPAVNGSYRWRVLGRRPDVTGNTRSSNRIFVTDFFAAGITPLSPGSGDTVVMDTPTFTWQESAGFALYRVIVRVPRVMTTWQQVEVICTGGVCSFTGTPLPDGDYEWQVQGRIVNVIGRAVSSWTPFTVTTQPQQ